jgi:hypothetical protein
VKWYGQYGGKVSWIVKWYINMVEKEVEKFKDMGNTEEKLVE